jgi:hypothetical protein
VARRCRGRTLGSKRRTTKKVEERNPCPGTRVNECRFYSSRLVSQFIVPGGERGRLTVGTNSYHLSAEPLRANYWFQCVLGKRGRLTFGTNSYHLSAEPLRANYLFQCVFGMIFHSFPMRARLDFIIGCVFEAVVQAVVARRNDG